MRRLLGLAAAWLIVLSAAGYAGFSDVLPGSWYSQAVEEMTESGWLSGYEDHTFRPHQLITRGEFVSIVARRAGLEPERTQSRHWADGYLQAARSRGWYDWDEIPPTGETYDQPISRQVAVKILMNALLPDEKGDYAVNSAKIADFSLLGGRYYNAVLAAYACGVVNGDETGAFHPTEGLTRAETCILVQRAAQKAAGQTTAPPPEAASQNAVSRGGVSENGRLQVVGVQLCNQSGDPVVLRGMSSHGVQWYGQFTSSGAISSTAAYGANLFRIAMYTEENGYLSRPECKDRVIAAMDAAISQNMYVILDWHILSDGNPMTHLTQAKEFFAEMAQRYKNSPAVIYEICNEPNGAVTWSGDIKPYAEQVIACIRQHAPDAVVLVGSGTWSQDIDQAAADPLKEKNIMYTCHFYAGTHGAFLRERIDAVRKQGLAVFISEWGTSRADGGSGVYLDESKVWLDFLAERSISWANWSLCDKQESSAALRPGANPNGPWSQDDLTESGKFVFSQFSR